MADPPVVSRTVWFLLAALGGHSAKTPSVILQCQSGERPMSAPGQTGRSTHSLGMAKKSQNPALPGMHSAHEHIAAARFRLGSQGRGEKAAPLPGAVTRLKLAITVLTA